MSRPLHDKLRRLRREDARTAPARPPTPELPVWLRHKLRGRASEVPAAVGSLEPPAELVDHAGGWAERTRRFPVSHAHGTWRLEEVLSADATAPARLTGDERLTTLDPATAVFLDIEATGLSGGAGTIPFLVALGRFAPDAFTLWQGFLRGPEDEAALLGEVARRVRASSGVVSFFGKSYDRHRLEDKMRLHGVEPPFDDVPHLDLFHPLARLVKGSLPDAKLQRLERELCGVEREDDLPGSFAPAAWFDFLRGRPHRLDDVFRHNQDDVLSLVTLAAYLGVVEDERRATGEAVGGCARTRALALASWFLKRGTAPRALVWAERADERGGGPAAWLVGGDARRRLGEHRAACEDFERAARGGDARVALLAAVGAAKVAEHRLQDPARALVAVDRGLELAAEGALRAELGRRRDRLVRKCSAGG